MTEQVLHCGVQTEPWRGIIVGGYYRRVEKSPLSSQCLRIKWQDTSGHAIPSSSSSSFFSKYKNKTKKYADSQVWLKNCEWQVLIGRFGSVPLPSRILTSFLFLFFLFLLFFFASFFVTYTHSVKFLWRVDLVLHLQCNWHPESNTYYYNMFTHVFFVQQYQRGARQKWFTPREREKQKRLKIIIIKKKEIQIFVPCCNPPQMEKGLTLNTKISQFLYIKLPLLALVQEYTHFSGELICWENLYFQPSGFTVFDYHLLSKLSNALCIAANMTCPGRFSASFFFFFFDEPPCFFFSFFHITKLQFYSHIFKFKFLLLNPLKKQ